MKKQRTAWLLCLVTAAVLPLAACGGTGTASGTSAGPETTAGTSAAPETTQAETTAAEETRKNGFTAGTYESVVTGHNARFTVRVTVDEDSIVSVEAVDDLETPGVGRVALARLGEKIVEEQSAGVDTVAGATVSSYAMLGGVKDCLEQAGGDMEALTASVSTVNTEKIVVDTDVVVIGGGGAGMAAAISAQQNGAKVVVVEKLDYLGGSTVVSGGAYNAADEERQKAEEMTDARRETIEGYLAADFEDDTVKAWQQTLRTEFEEYKEAGETNLFDTPSLHMIQTYVGGHNVGTPELIEYLCANSLDSLCWLEDLGLEFKETLGTATGAIYQRSYYTAAPAGTGYAQVLGDYLDQSEDIQVYYRCPATELLTDGSGRVTGVVCQYGEGTLTVNASRGVILATGGFGSNVKLRQEVNTGVWAEADLGSGIGCSNINPCAQGDGLNLATAVGAQLTGMSDIQLHPCGNPATGLMDAIRTSGRNRLFVNVAGERFVNEGAARDTLCKAIFAQEGSTYWVVVNSVRYPARDWVDSNGNKIEDMVALGLVIEGDTIEELAEKTGMDPVKLQASVDQYNAAVRGEAEDPLGFKVASADVELVDGPWYACKKVPTVHHTMGGVAINTDCQVLDESNEAHDFSGRRDHVPLFIRKGP